LSELYKKKFPFATLKIPSSFNTPLLFIPTPIPTPIPMSGIPMPETFLICNRAYALRDGEILAEGGPTEIVFNWEVRFFYLGKKFKIQLFHWDLG